MIKKIFFGFLDILLRVLSLKPLVKFLKKYKMFGLVFLTALAFLFAEWLKTFSIDEILEYKQSLLRGVHKQPFSFGLSFFLIYFLVSTISLPGTTVLAVLGGFFFGLVKGVTLSIFAVSLGSSLAFFITRFFLHGFFMKKGGKRMQKIFKFIQQDEIYYLFAFRLFPFTPLFFTNLIMGLSSIKFRAFYVVSFISLLPVVAIYANIGSQISQLETTRGLVEPNILFSFALMGVFPLCVRYLLKFLKRLKIP